MLHNRVIASVAKQSSINALFLDDGDMNTYIYAAPEVSSAELLFASPIPVRKIVSQNKLTDKEALESIKIDFENGKDGKIF